MRSLRTVRPLSGIPTLLLLLANCGQSFIVRNSFTVLSSKPGAWTFSAMKKNPFGFLSGGDAKVTITCQSAGNPTEGGLSFSADNATALSSIALAVKNGFQLMLCENYEDMKPKMVRDSFCASTAFASRSSCLNFMQNARVCVEPAFVEDWLLPKEKVTVTNMSVGGDSFASDLSFKLTFQRKVRSSTFLSALLIWCCSSQLEAVNLACKSEVLLLNPGGEHLSSDQIPLRVLYLVMACIWLLLLAAWCCNWAFNYKFSNNLHRLITAIPLFKILLLFMQHVRWQQVSQTDVESDTVQVFRHAFQSLSWTSYLIVLMLAAEGWCIIRRKAHLHKYTLGITSMFLMSMFLYYWVHHYFQSIAAVLAGLVLYFTLKFAQQSCRVVHHLQHTLTTMISARRLNYTSKKKMEDRMGAKRRLFHALVSISVLYPLLFISLSMVSEFRLKQIRWLRDQLGEYLDVLITILLLFDFRLRECKQYHKISMDRKQEKVDTTVLLSPGVQNLFIAEHCQCDCDDMLVSEDSLSYCSYHSSETHCSTGSGHDDHALAGD